MSTSNNGLANQQRPYISILIYIGCVDQEWLNSAYETRENRVDAQATRCYAGAVRDADCKPVSIPRRDFSKQGDLFKVLADPLRLKIFAAIARSEGEVRVCDLT